MWTSLTRSHTKKYVILILLGKKKDGELDEFVRISPEETVC